MPTNRQNVTDKQQDQIEEAQFEGGVAVFDNGKTRVISKNAPQAAAQRTANAGTNLRNNAGVVMPHDDAPNRFVGDTQGKS